MSRYSAVVFALVVVVLGVVSGMAVAYYQVHRLPWSGRPLVGITPSEPIAVPSGGNAQGAAAARPSGAFPRVETPEIEHDFGPIESEGKYRHEFLVRNVGDAPLTLRVGDSSCRCTVLDFSQATLQPQEGIKIPIQFDAHEYFGPVSQHATLVTNDPRNPRVILRIKANVERSIRVVPAELVFSRIVRNQAATGEVRVVIFRRQPVTITDIRFDEVRNETLQFLELSHAPLTAAELAGEPGATGGYRIMVRVKPGLPVGPFQQKIRITTDQSDIAPLEVPVHGRVESEYGIIGSGWNAQRGILHLGRIQRESGSQARIMLRLPALPGQTLEVEPVRTLPDFVQVQVREEETVQAADSVLIPIVITIPAGAGPANYFGDSEEELGKIILKTNHPTAPEIKILLRLAVD
ncbi:MAG: DUF1573 domain-containing protein [Thermogutta sp.]|nr:DUF1573 domain-containing protein [Thermogutta sp.]